MKNRLITPIMAMALIFAKEKEYTELSHKSTDFTKPRLSNLYQANI